MKTIICVALMMFIALAFASALPAPDGESLDTSNVNAPAAVEGEALQPDESRWGYGGYGRGYGGGWGRGYGGGWGRGYGGWGGGYGGWGGGWGRGYGWGR